MTGGSGLEESGTRELLGAAMLGDQAAWNALVDRYSRLVWSVARSYRLSDADAADVCQTTWLRLVEHLDQIGDPDRLAVWLAITARHEAVAVLHKHDREVPEFDGPDEDDGDEKQNPEPQSIAQDEYRELWNAFAALSERCRALLRVLAVSPLENYAQIATTLGMPVDSIGPTRSRCLNRLRSRLNTPSRPTRVVDRREPRPRDAGSPARRPMHGPPQAGVPFRIGFDLDVTTDRPWAWPQDGDGNTLPVRVLVVSDDASVRPPTRVIAPDAGLADTVFEVTPRMTGPVSVRVLVYCDAVSAFLEESTGVVSKLDLDAPGVIRASID